MIEKFEKWFNNLSSADQQSLLRHIASKYNLNEGYFSGPTGKIEKGLFTGPSTSTGRTNCPYCGRPL